MERTEAAQELERTEEFEWADEPEWAKALGWTQENLGRTKEELGRVARPRRTARPKGPLRDEGSETTEPPDRPSRTTWATRPWPRRQELIWFST